MNTPDTEVDILIDDVIHDLEALDFNSVDARNVVQKALSSRDTYWKERGERIICSAVRFNGKVWMGHRHGNAIEAMNQELSYTMNRKQMNEAQTDRDQVFVTSTGRFVDRAEAWAIAEKAGQIIKREYQTKDCLYSEDVW